MKVQIVCLVAILLIVIMIAGCKAKSEKSPNVKTEAIDTEDINSNGYGPSKKLIKEEFQQLWTQIHGNKDTGSNWVLIDTEVGAIRADEKSKSAIVNIRFTYSPSSKPQRTKAADFSFLQKDGFWEIDKATAKYPITP
jgi:hypothetical protein